MACGLGRGGVCCGRGLWSEKRWSLELGSKFHPKQETTKLSCSYLSEAREELEAQQEESGEEVGSFLKPGPPAGQVL